MKAFKEKSFFELRKMSISEIKEYYYELKNYLIEYNKFDKNSETIARLQKLKFLVIKILRIISHDSLEIYTHKYEDKTIKINKVSNVNLDLKKSTIIAFTHICMQDIERIFEAIKINCTLICGDPEYTLGKFPDQLFMWLNNSIFTDSDNSIDAAFTLKIILEQLQTKEKIYLWSPEGIWCVGFDNALVFELYDGPASAAILGNADILPLGIDRDNKKYRIMIGEKISSDKYIKLNIKRKEKIKLLSLDIRDSLATLKYELLLIKSRKNENGKESSPRTFVTRNDLITKYKINYKNHTPYKFDENGNHLYDLDKVLFEIENSQILSEWVDKEGNQIYTNDVIIRRKKQTPNINPEYIKRFGHFVKNNPNYK